MDDIPDFAKPLASYVGTRQETLCVRQALTRHIYSQLKSEGDEPVCHLSASTGCNVDSVTETSQGLKSGVHARYLEALRRNVAARKEHDEALRDLERLKEEQSRQPTTHGGPLSGGQQPLHAYLSVLRSRRERDRMQLLRHYLDKLNAMDAALPEYLALDEETNKTSQASEILDSDSGASQNFGAPTEDGVEAIVQGLERNVLRTKHRLDSERKKRDAARARSSSNANAVDTVTRLKALSRVRDELVLWIEEKLATSSSTEDSIVAYDHATNDGDVGSASASLRTKKTRIEEQYKEYLATRQALLHAVSAASYPLPKDDKRNIPIRHDARTEPNQKVTADPMAILENVFQRLLPLSEAHKQAVLQSSYLSAILEKERCTTSNALERLQDESRLLPEQDITADIVDKAESWVSASAAAGDATNHSVKEKLAVGTEMARNTEGALQDLYGTMNGDYVGATAKDTNDKDTLAAGSGTARSRRGTRRGASLETRFHGPWSALDGKVGVIGDG